MAELDSTAAALVEERCLARGTAVEERGTSGQRAAIRAGNFIVA